MSKDSSRFVGVVRTVLACAAGSENTAQGPSTSFEKQRMQGGFDKSRDEFETCDEF